MQGLYWWFSGKESADLIVELGKSSGGGNSNPLQYSCLGIHMERGAWQATVHGVAEDLDTT